MFDAARVNLRGCRISSADGSIVDVTIFTSLPDGCFFL
jgi:hypothetical protein